MDGVIEFALVLGVAIALILQVPLRLGHVGLQLAVIVQRRHDFVGDLLVLERGYIYHVLAVGARQVLDLRVSQLVEVAGDHHVFVEELAFLLLDLPAQVLRENVEPAVGECLRPLMPILGVLGVQVAESGVQVGVARHRVLQRLQKF